MPHLAGFLSNCSATPIHTSHANSKLNCALTPTPTPTSTTCRPAYGQVWVCLSGCPPQTIHQKQTETDMEQYHSTFSLYMPIMGMLHIISGHVDKWDNSDTVKRSARQTDRHTWTYCNDHLGTGVKTMQVPRSEAPCGEITLKSH